MKYGKIICGTLHVPQNYPCSISIEGKRINNPTEEQLLAAGYLPLEETEPVEREGKVAVATYKVSKDGTKITQSWKYVNAPTPEETEQEPINE